MHPDLYLVIYRHAERELERKLERRRSMLSRDDGPGRTGRAARHHDKNRRHRH